MNIGQNILRSNVISRISGGFLRTENSFCRSSNTYGSYDNLLSAKIACISDDKCIGIYETYHHKTMTFDICRNGFITSYLHTSVIYQRETHISSHFWSGK